YAHQQEVCAGCPVARCFEDGAVHVIEKSVPNGSRTSFIEIKASPLRDKEGTVVAAVEVVRDITLRKSAELALAESEERYRMLFESAGDAIFVLDLDGERAGAIVDANRAAAEMHGYTVKELKRLKITDLDSKEAASEAPERLAQIKQGKWVKAEISHRRKDGSEFPVEINAGLLQVGNHRYILAFDRDISERKIAEHERETLIGQLRSALENIKTLRGLLPICAWCKKVRDDQGYWKGVEDYIEEHSEAMFTHGICPDCLKKNDPDLYDKIYEP
ncbi:MAG: PAS domain-containing protein, partial [Thermodesulfovibrionales bacterium]